jgi:hypothetical protein
VNIKVSIFFTNLQELPTNGNVFRIKKYAQYVKQNTHKKPPPASSTGHYKNLQVSCLTSAKHWRGKTCSVLSDDGSIRLASAACPSHPTWENSQPVSAAERRSVTLRFLESGIKRQSISASCHLQARNLYRLSQSSARLSGMSWRTMLLLIPLWHNRQKSPEILGIVGMIRFEEEQSTENMFRAEIRQTQSAITTTTRAFSQGSWWQSAMESTNHIQVRYTKYMWLYTVEIGSLHTLRLELLKLVFQPFHKCLVNKL